MLISRVTKARMMEMLAIAVIPSNLFSRLDRNQPLVNVNSSEQYKA
jgi:hypothetical protein